MAVRTDSHNGNSVLSREKALHFGSQDHCFGQVQERAGPNFFKHPLLAGLVRLCFLGEPDRQRTVRGAGVCAAFGASEKNGVSCQSFLDLGEGTVVLPSFSTCKGVWGLVVSNLRTPPVNS